MTYVIQQASRQDDPVIAYVCLRQIDAAMHLLKVAVAPAWRKRGIATWLLNSCFKKIADTELRAVQLEVRPANTAAQALYKKLGFKLIGIRPKYYTDTGEDALVLVKQLKEV
jgi:ribosomal-protein-alanine N-acetyltransferase